MNDIPETAYCHNCNKDTPTRIMSFRPRVASNVCRVCRTARKGRPNVPYAWYDEWMRTHVLTEADVNYVTGRERRQLAHRAKMDANANKSSTGQEPA